MFRVVGLVDFSKMYVVDMDTHIITIVDNQYVVENIRSWDLGCDSILCQATCRGRLLTLSIDAFINTIETASTVVITSSLGATQIVIKGTEVTLGVASLTCYYSDSIYFNTKDLCFAYKDMYRIWNKGEYYVIDTMNDMVTVGYLDGKLVCCLERNGYFIEISELSINPDAYISRSKFMREVLL